MGLRFKKSIKIAPGVKMNVGKKSVGISVGGKHGGLSFNSRTGARARVSAPGTGLSYSTKIGKGKKKSSHKNKTTSTRELNLQNQPAEIKYSKNKIYINGEPKSPKSYKIYYRIMYVIITFCLLIGLPTLAVGGIGFVIIGAIALIPTLKWRKLYKAYLEHEKSDTFQEEPNVNSYISLEKQDSSFNLEKSDLSSEHIFFTQDDMEQFNLPYQMPIFDSSQSTEFALNMNNQAQAKKDISYLNTFLAEASELIGFDPSFLIPIENIDFTDIFSPSMPKMIAEPYTPKGKLLKLPTPYGVLNLEKSIL